MLAGLITGVDQASKLLVLRYLPPQESFPVIADIFHLTLVLNPGIAFGLFHSHPEVLHLLISLTILIMVVGSFFIKEGSFLSQLPFALILGGAVGNWIDRMRVGVVIDFLDFRIWPVFNLADSAISIGAFIYFWMFFRPSKS